MRASPFPPVFSSSKLTWFDTEEPEWATTKRAEEEVDKELDEFTKLLDLDLLQSVGFPLLGADGNLLMEPQALPDVDVDAGLE